MLKSLSINNYALIDEIEIAFHEGFSVITGETGAGKSIILGALSLILGQRSDVSALKNKDVKCVVECMFDIGEYGLQAFFEGHDVDFDQNTNIRREVLPSGKSRAFVNDTPVNLAFLKELTSRLIDIHSQHQNLLLADADFQLMVIDTVAKNAKQKADYEEVFARYKELVDARRRLEAKGLKEKEDADYFQFQFDQLEKAVLKNGEQIEIEKELEALSHSEEIKTNLATVFSSLEDDEKGALPSLKMALTALQKVGKYIKEGDGFVERLDSAYIDLKDLCAEVEAQCEDVVFDPERIKYLNDRLDLIYSLQQKHHVTSVEALLELQNDISQKLSRISSFDEDLEVMAQQIVKLEESLGERAELLTKSRCRVFKNIEKVVSGQLADLGMPNATFVVNHQQLEVFRSGGIDGVKFLFSANKNGSLDEVFKVASGGEMSRVMLCIKGLLSSSKGLPTILFDEIDTGVSGEIAEKMGAIMHEMGENIQVLSITHLPQIAGKGSVHYKVYKTETANLVKTSISLLSKDQRITEVAKMLSGRELSDAALSNAKELLGYS